MVDHGGGISGFKKVMEAQLRAKASARVAPPVEDVTLFVAVLPGLAVVRGKPFIR
jgi:hypothetical protein